MQIDLTKINNPNDSIAENHVFFKRDDKHLFTAEYIPKRTVEKGVVLCAPFAEEKVRTVRIFISLSRALATLGIAVVYFDYFGDGDSEGAFEDADFDDRLKDIRAVYNNFQKKHNLQRMGLLGLRWGGTLATLCLDALQPDLLVLWEPVVDTEKYFFNHLRSHVAAQMLVDGKVTKNRDEMVEELRNGQIHMVEGYNLTGDFFFKAQQEGLLGKQFSYPGKVQIVQISGNPARIRPELVTLKEAFPEGEIVAVPREFEWEKTETWQPAPPELFAKTLEFLEENDFF